MSRFTYQLILASFSDHKVAIKHSLEIILSSFDMLRSSSLISHFMFSFKTEAISVNFLMNSVFKVANLRPSRRDLPRNE